MVGIRPEAARLTPENADDLAIDFWVTTVTQIGSETLLFGTINGREEPLQFKIAGQHDLTAQQFITLYIPRSALHYFQLAGKMLATVGV